MLAILVSLTTVSYANATLHGLSGTMLVPGLDVLPPGSARAAVHFSGKNEFAEGSFKGVFAFADDSEVAVSKKFTFTGRNNQTDPVFSGKYKIRPNMAVAAFIDPNDEQNDSVMLLSGLPGNRVVLGVGANISMNDNARKSSFGRFDEKTQKVDPLFFVMGASLNLDLDTKLMIDYTGNEFCIGVRHRFDEALSLDFGLFTPDRVHDENRYLVGANFGF